MIKKLTTTIFAVLFMAALAVPASAQMTDDEVLRYAELATNAANLVFEEPLEGFAELEVHLLGQTTHIVVGLDDLAGDIERLDTVWIDSALGKPLGVGDLLGLGIEDLDEVAADDLAFLLRVGDALQIGEEALAGVHTDDIEA